jgi:hypothetical protein
MFRNSTHAKTEEAAQTFIEGIQQVLLEVAYVVSGGTLRSGGRMM